MGHQSLTGVRQESPRTELAWGGDDALMCAMTVTTAEENVHMGQGRGMVTKMEIGYIVGDWSNK